MTAGICICCAVTQVGQGEGKWEETSAQVVSLETGANGTDDAPMYRDTVTSILDSTSKYPNKTEVRRAHMDDACFVCQYRVPGKYLVPKLLLQARVFT